MPSKCSKQAVSDAGPSPLGGLWITSWLLPPEPCPRGSGLGILEVVQINETVANFAGTREGSPLTEKRILLLKPRGFCAGVVRAIDVVKIALDLYGPPVYVRKEIVHNKHVVDELRDAGAVFVEELDEVPRGARA